MEDQKTLLEYFYDKENACADEVFLRQPFGDRWDEYSWSEVGNMARKMASAILSYELPPKSNIGIISKNCREWIITDLAIMLTGHVSVPLYPTLTGDQLAEVLELGDVALLFIGKTEVWDDMKNGIPEAMRVIKFPHYEYNDLIDRGTEWEQIMSDYAPLNGSPLPGIDDLWTIVFTSGTTGTPKGVMLSYRILVNLLNDTSEDNHLQLSKTGKNRFFSYLPLNHIAERAIIEVSCIYFGGSISFGENLASFTQNLVDARPTVFFAVPRIWTKFQLGILAKMPQEKLDRLLRIPIVSSLVKRKIKRGLGLDHSRVNVSGAAPITEECKNWYAKLGIYISEGYGMSENCAVCSWLSASDNRPGSVGRPAGGTEIGIDKKTGEVLMKAGYVMNGYYKNPEQTKETIKDGWLHTGDQGYLDEEGYLYLTGRIKDTFKTAKGEFIVPAPLEFGFSGNKDIEQICILGLGLPQPIALVSLSDVGKSRDKNLVKTKLQETLEKVNSELDNYKKVSTIVVTKEPFSVENGMLTPTLKTKRNEINNKYRDRLEKWELSPESIILEDE